MNSTKMLNELHEQGMDSGTDLHDGLESPGWFGWKLGYEHGNRVLVITFEDQAGESTEHAWVLNPLR